MTDDRMALVELIEKRADTDLVREMLAFAAARLMDLEVETLTGAPAGARRMPSCLAPTAPKLASATSLGRHGVRTGIAMIECKLINSTALVEHVGDGGERFH